MPAVELARERGGGRLSMISCRRATELMSKRREERLTLREILNLWMHFYICKACRTFDAHIRSIAKALRTSEPAAPAPPLGAKERLKEQLKKKEANTGAL